MCFIMDTFKLAKNFISPMYSNAPSKIVDSHPLMLREMIFISDKSFKTSELHFVNDKSTSIRLSISLNASQIPPDVKFLQELKSMDFNPSNFAMFCNSRSLTGVLERFN